MQQWYDDNKITLQYIQPGRSMQNAYIEGKNGTIRGGILAAYIFHGLSEV
ncbi:hypothetical protein DVR12_19465 [Chitinophaga silvatica]|uniref:Integrase catalytic domain-containing protein n=1 Tax=Chitinophaga silvatica TaxID=2282649 RepID=A0A3E1Y746_9BACT|nr:hypothetical protein DVR12_19465 [Chitinophaga silvatica]